MALGGVARVFLRGPSTTNLVFHAGSGGDEALTSEFAKDSREVERASKPVDIIQRCPERTVLNYPREMKKVGGLYRFGEVLPVGRLRGIGLDPGGAAGVRWETACTSWPSPTHCRNACRPMNPKTPVTRYAPDPLAWWDLAEQGV